LNILITDRHESEYSLTLGATCGKVSGVVSVHRRDNSLQVLCVNAAHRCWRGGGRYMASLADALEVYKSAEMKAIIQLAYDEATGKAFAA
jgi:hypothetical protein